MRKHNRGKHRYNTRPCTKHKTSTHMYNTRQRTIKFCLQIDGDICVYQARAFVPQYACVCASIHTLMSYINYYAFRICDNSLGYFESWVTRSSRLRVIAVKWSMLAQLDVDVEADSVGDRHTLNGSDS